jgi:soluble lytic murein transglycosylase-like protein
MTVLKRSLAGTAALAIASNAVAAFAFDDRFPHLFSAPPVQTEQADTAVESVPMPRRAPHKAKAKNAAAPTPAADAKESTKAPVTTAEKPEPAPTQSTVSPQVAGMAHATPEPADVGAAPTVGPSQKTHAPPPPAQMAPHLGAPLPMAFSAPPQAYGRGEVTARVSSFEERFTFIITAQPEPVAEKPREVLAAAADVPLPKPAPKRIRTIPVSGAALPFAPIAGDLSALIEAKAKTHGVPLALAHAVVHVESQYNPKVTGRGGTHGLMQIKYATAKSMGYDGTIKELYDPETNLEWGMRYLGSAHRLAKGDVCGTVKRYQGGLRVERMSDIAVKYCSKVHALLARRSTPASTAVARTRPAASSPAVAEASLPAPPPAPTRAALAFY